MSSMVIVYGNSEGKRAAVWGYKTRKPGTSKQMGHLRNVLARAYYVSLGGRRPTKPPAALVVLQASFDTQSNPILSPHG